MFLQLKSPSPRRENYHEVRQDMLKIACGAARNRFSHLNTVVGIAMDPPKLTEPGEISEYFALLDLFLLDGGGSGVLGTGERGYEIFQNPGHAEDETSRGGFSADTVNDCEVHAKRV